MRVTYVMTEPERESVTLSESAATSFTLCWTASQSAVFAFISASIPNFSDAEDVLQRVASVAVHKYDQYDPERPFIAWVIGIARFEVMRFLRDRGSSRLEYVSDSIDDLAETFESLQPELDERREALANCLKHLNGRAREVLEQRYAHGKKTSRIAEALGLTSTNVSVILNRAYRSLRDCIESKLANET